MGIDWETILGAEGADLERAYNNHIWWPTADEYKYIDEYEDEDEDYTANTTDSEEDGGIPVITEENVLDCPYTAETDNLETAHEVHAALASANVPENYCDGIWRGTKVHFKKTFSNHTFTEKECEKLLADEVIEFLATDKKGREYIAKGKLKYRGRKGNKYVGFGFV